MTALGDVEATVGIVDGRVAMSADVETGLYFETPDATPLSKSEPHATLRVAGEDVRAEIDVDVGVLNALASEASHAANAGCDAPALPVMVLERRERGVVVIDEHEPVPPGRVGVVVASYHERYDLTDADRWVEVGRDD